MHNNPDYQKTLISWCLKNPDDVTLYFDHLKEVKFTDPTAAEIWPLLTKVFESEYEWPNQTEVAVIVAKHFAKDPTLDLVQEWAKELYAMNSTQVTGDYVRDWVAKQKLYAIHASVGSHLSEGTGYDKIQELKKELEAVEMLYGAKVSSSNFRPLDPNYIQNCEKKIQEGYGGAPVPTGIYRLDRKLRDGGMRAHNVLLQGPSGVGKTSLLLSILAYNLRLGSRVVCFFFDDSAGDVTERMYASMLQQPFSIEQHIRNGTLLETQARLMDLKGQYTGDFHGIALDPNFHTPQDLIRMLVILQKKLYAIDKIEAKSRNIPEDQWGSIQIVGIDTANQVIKKGNKGAEWADGEWIHQQLAAIPKRFGCPLIMTTQSGQQTVGASQVTERSLATSFGIARPAKLILGFAQTFDMYHTDITIPFTHPSIQQNLPHMWNYNPINDKDTLWKRFWLCLNKNTRGREGFGAASKVKIPQFIHYGSCRIVEDFTSAEEIMLVDKVTQREEREATGGAKPPRVGGKRNVR